MQRALVLPKLLVTKNTGSLPAAGSIHVAEVKASGRCRRQRGCRSAHAASWAGERSQARLPQRFAWCVRNSAAAEAGAAARAANMLVLALGCSFFCCCCLLRTLLLECDWPAGAAAGRVGAGLLEAVAAAVWGAPAAADAPMGGAELHSPAVAFACSSSSDMCDRCIDRACRCRFCRSPDSSWPAR